MKAGPDRKCTVEFREAAVRHGRRQSGWPVERHSSWPDKMIVAAQRQVLDGGRSVRQVARSLEMSPKTLANWVARAKQRATLVKRAPAQPVNELQAELARLRQENARLRLEKEILKKAAAYFARESM